jgi:site-specific recombinase XerD
MLRHPRKKVKFLLLEECRQCIRSLLDPTHRLLFRVSLQTGLRNEELRTFPEKYVVDPMRDMKLKNGKDREIDVSASLMADLWDYSVHDRPSRAALRTRDTPVLFLTTQGTTVSASTLQSMFDALSSRVGFHVHPHMLRHTFATYTLYELHKRKYKGDPLMYVADRLGHSSLYTTQVYLHLLRDIEAGLIELYESELDKLFQEA